MIKYLGSKRKFTGLLGAMCEASGAQTALDLFTGTTRVAQELRLRGVAVTAVDLARYSEVFGRCFLEADPADFAPGEIEAALAELAARPGVRGYVTRTFCEEARFFTPENGQRIDAIRDAIEQDYAGSPLYPVLLTSLILAADRVDSTTGVQMAYLKAYAPRALRPLELRTPELVAGPRGRALRAEAAAGARTAGRVDFAYLDPPYNQHSYYGNYHIWETLVAWDAPEAYGVARKRADVRESQSAFNSRRRIAGALADALAATDAAVTVVSFSNEGHLALEDLGDLARAKGAVRVLSFDYKRYVGAQIGIFNPAGRKTGAVSHLRNLEHLLVCGEDEALVEQVAAAAHLVAPALFGASPVGQGLTRQRAGK